MGLARLGNKLKEHMMLAQLGELSKTIAWTSLPARDQVEHHMELPRLGARN